MKFDQPHKQQRNRANATLSFVVKKTHSIRTDQLERAQQPTQWHQRDESNNNTFEGEQTSTPKVQNAFFHKLKVTSRHSRPPRPSPWSPLSHSAPTTSSNQLKGGTSHPPPTSIMGLCASANQTTDSATNVNNPNHDDDGPVKRPSSRKSFQRKDTVTNPCSILEPAKKPHNKKFPSTYPPPPPQIDRRLGVCVCCHCSVLSCCVSVN